MHLITGHLFLVGLFLGIGGTIVTACLVILFLDRSRASRVPW